MLRRMPFELRAPSWFTPGAKAIDWLVSTTLTRLGLLGTETLRLAEPPDASAGLRSEERRVGKECV